MRRMGRPGLVGMAARTAVVAGTAGAVSHHQQTKYAAKDQAAYDQQVAQQQAAAAAAPAAAAPAAAAAAAPAEDDQITKIKELGELHAQGLLSDEEFAAAKSKILGI